MNTRLNLGILIPVVALALAACGGGGGGGDGGGGPPPGGQTGTVTTDLQAKLLAARSANALFAYDNMNSESVVAALAALPIGPALSSGVYAAQCAAGTGSAALTDADGSGTISAGDSVQLAAHACQSNAALPWTLSGDLRVDIASGSAVQALLFYGTAGSVRVNVTHTGTALGGGRTATGGYVLEMSKPSDIAPLDQAVTMADLTIAHPDVNLHIVGLRFNVTGSTLISSATGTFTTSVSGIGDVDLGIAVKSPLTVDSTTTRFRPSSGTLTVTGATFSVDVEYGAAGVVTLRVDNGKDGSVDRTVATSELELDSLLTLR
jgi:hypothetical protein